VLCVYREDDGRQDHGWALLNGGFVPPPPDEDGLTITDAAAPVTSGGRGTYRAPGK
jgi:hypothetical protein